MKITTSLRVLLVLIAMTMVFSLFACTGETPSVESDSENETITSEKPEDESDEIPAGNETSNKEEATTEKESDSEGESESETETDTTETACQHVEEVLLAVAPTCTESGLTEGKKCSICNTVIVEQTVVAATGHTLTQVAAVEPTCVEEGNVAYSHCSVCEKNYNTEGEEIADVVVAIDSNNHAWDAGITDDDAACGSTADVTYTCTNEGCEETRVEVGAVVEHAWESTGVTAPTCIAVGSESFECTRDNCDATKTEEIAIDANAHSLKTVAAVAATCTDAGNIAHKHCELCNKNFDEFGGEIANVVVEAKGHTEEDLAAVAPTCSATGLTAGKKCTTCNTETVKQTVVAIDANAHKWIDVPAKKPAPHEDGYEAYKDCEYCDKVADTNGDVISAIVTIPGLDCEVYFDAEKMYNTHFSGISNVNKVLSDDGSYIRYEIKADFNDGYMELITNNENVTGQYLVFKYKTDQGTNGNIWANTISNGHDNGSAYMNFNYVGDGKWNIAVIDLSKNITSHVKASEDGQYRIKWARVDFLDNAKTGGYFEMAFMMICDDLNDVAFALDDADRAACTHQYINVDENCYGVCSFCKADLGNQHNVKETYVDNGTTRTYKKACVNCGGAEEYSYNVEFGANKPNVFINAGDIFEKGSVTNCTKTLSADGTYVTFTDKAGASEGYWNVYAGNGSVTGQFLLIKYRTNNTMFEFYLGANNGRNGAAGGEEFYFNPVTDGTWQVAIIDMSNGAMFNANEDGTYSASYIRWDLLNGKGTGSRTIDVAYAAIADDLGELLYIDDLDAYTAFMTFSGKNGNPMPMSAQTEMLYLGATHLASVSDKATVIVDEESGMTYARYKSNGSGSENRFNVWTSNKHGRSVAKTGDYLVLMYRKPANATSDWVDAWISSNLQGANGSGDALTQQQYIIDGDWHVVILSLAGVNHDKSLVESGSKKSYYIPEEGITGLTIDWFNTNGETSNPDAYIDVAYVAFFETMEDAAGYVADYNAKYLSDRSCKHELKNPTAKLVDDGDPNTCTAIKSSTCYICGAALDAVPISSAINVDGVKGGTQIKVKGTYDAAANGFTLSESGTIQLVNGWAGTDFPSASTLAYRVFDANGNLLVDWTATGTAFYPSGEPAVVNAVKSAGFAAETARRIKTDAIDLSSYVADGAKITFELALVIDGVPEGSNDKYITILSYTNLGAYQAPEA